MIHLRRCVKQQHGARTDTHRQALISRNAVAHAPECLYSPCYVLALRLIVRSIVGVHRVCQDYLLVKGAYLSVGEHIVYVTVIRICRHTHAHIGLHTEFCSLYRCASVAYGARARVCVCVCARVSVCVCAGMHVLCCVRTFAYRFFTCMCHQCNKECSYLSG